MNFIRNKIKISFYKKTNSLIFFIAWISSVFNGFVIMLILNEPVLFIVLESLVCLVFFYVLIFHFLILKKKNELEENKEATISYKAFLPFFISEKKVIEIINNRENEKQLFEYNLLYNSKTVWNIAIPIPYFWIIMLKNKGGKLMKKEGVLQKLQDISSEFKKHGISTVIKGSFSFQFYEGFEKISKYNDIDLFFKNAQNIKKEEMIKLLDKHGKVVFYNSFLITLILEIYNKEVRMDIFLVEDIDIKLCKRVSDNLFVVPIEYLLLTKIFHLPRLKKTEIFPYDEKIEKAKKVIDFILKKELNNHVLNELTKQIVINNIKLLFHIEYDEDDLSLSSFLKEQNDWLKERFYDKRSTLFTFLEDNIIKNKYLSLLEFMFLNRYLLIESLFEIPIILNKGWQEKEFLNSNIKCFSEIIFDEHYENQTEIRDNIIYAKDKEQIFWMLLTIFDSEKVSYKKDTQKYSLDINLNKEFEKVLVKNDEGKYEISVDNLINKIEYIYFELTE